MGREREERAEEGSFTDVFAVCNSRQRCPGYFDELQCRTKQTIRPYF